MKKTLGIVCILSAVMLTAAACGKKTTNEETVAETRITIASETAAETETESTADTSVPEGMMRSYLTGEIEDISVASQRPYAIMINNIQAALPQSGISSADMIYEAQVEGGITRLLALFEDPSDIERIGSIRSARHYYIDFANDNKALYVHYGQSVYAKERMENENITTIHGLSGYESSVFYRSSERQAPHNVYTDAEMLAEGVSITGLSREMPADYTGRLLFNTEDIIPAAGASAATVNIPFDSAPYFTYNTSDGLYYRYQYGEAHTDDLNDQQVAVKNIIVQYVEESTISEKGHQDLVLNGSGEALYISDGKAVNATWKRTDDDDQTKFYDADGKQISINPGKTFFELVPNSETVTFE